MVGVAVGAFEGAWRDPIPPSPMRSVARMCAGHAGQLAAIAAVFGGTEATLANMRGENVTNSMVAGCVAGSLPGGRFRFLLIRRAPPPLAGLWNRSLCSFSGEAQASVAVATRQSRGRAHREKRAHS